MSLTKLQIFAFEKKTMQEHVASFRLPINPESFSRDLKIKNDDSQAQGTRGTSQKTSEIKPEEVKLEFVFDNTGTVLGNLLDGTEVTDQINQFLAVVYNYDGKIHEPRKLRLVWGDFTFDCKLTSLAINYPLFKPDGKPLRAKLNGNFVEYIEDEKRARRENSQSPDLTHVRTFSGETTLAWMAYDIYGKNDFYLQVANINGLTSPRLVRPDQQLIFPPIKKATE